MGILSKFRLQLFAFSSIHFNAISDNPDSVCIIGGLAGGVVSVKLGRKKGLIWLQFYF